LAGNSNFWRKIYFLTGIQIFDGKFKCLEGNSIFWWKIKFLEENSNFRPEIQIFGGKFKILARHFFVGKFEFFEKIQIVASFPSKILTSFSPEMLT
jgi:hypothetical protein